MFFLFLNNYFTGLLETDKWVLSGLLILIRHGDRGPLQHVKKISSINCGTDNSELLTSYKVQCCFDIYWFYKLEKPVVIFYSTFICAYQSIFNTQKLFSDYECTLWAYIYLYKEAHLNINLSVGFLMNLILFT